MNATQAERLLKLGYRLFRTKYGPEAVYRIIENKVFFGKGKGHFWKVYGGDIDIALSAARIADGTLLPFQE